MTRKKKVLLTLLALTLLSQAPFIYRRYKLGRLHGAIARLNAERKHAPADDPYADYPGAIHAHTLLGGHSTGTFAEVVAGARASGLAFVVMTEHPSRYVDTAEATLRGTHDGVLFIGGSEINASGEDRLLVVPGIGAPEPGVPTQELIARAKASGRLVFIAYPEKLGSWELEGYDGIEVYNLYANSKKINYALLFFDGLWSYWSYPHLLFSTFYEKPEGNLRKWDELLRDGRRVVAVAGNDAHANVGLSLEELTGEKIFELKLDPYERSFSVVRTHALVERATPLSAEAILEALGRGRCFISFDLFGDATGFRFFAERGAEQKPMGDEITLDGGGVALRVRTPIPGRVVFLRDGGVIREERGRTESSLPVSEKGAYRVEVYLDGLGEPVSVRPWIISNPIYVR